MNILLVGLFAAAVATREPAKVYFFDMDAAVASQGLSYEEQLLMYVFEGLVNEAFLKAPVLMFNAGYMNFDWPGSDEYWNGSADLVVDEMNLWLRLARQSQSN